MCRVFFILILGFVFASCSSNEAINCNSDFENIYNKQIQKFENSSKSNGRVSILYDRGIDSGNVGGEYTFNESGKLKEYKFFTSKENYTYAEYYDKGGRLKKTEGNPIVFTNIEEINQDSVRFHFFVSSLQKEIISFQLKINSTNWFFLQQKDDTLFSNIKRYVYPFNAKDTSSIKVFKKLRYKNCGEVEREVIDSSFIERKEYPPFS